LEDHFEVLPSEKIERSTVDFGGSVSQSGTTLQSASKGTGKNQSVSAAPKAKPKQPALTPQEAAKLKHDQFVEAFHGRLAGIKHDVDSLNHKLDDFENKRS